VADNGAAGWMIWNAAAVFTRAALGPPADDEGYALVTEADPELGPSVAPSAPPSVLPLPSSRPSGSP
jgi:hypothetical protein